ncbi:MAG: folate-binding protein [Rhodanobacter sp.]
MTMTLLRAQTISIVGSDAIAFAHAQFASHVDTLDPGHWQFSAWLDANGRVRALFHLLRLGDDQLLCLLRGGDATTLSDALRGYVFRAKVSITAHPATSIATAAASAVHAVTKAGDALVLGCGDYGMQIGNVAAGDDDWRRLQWRDGWPWLPPAALDTWLPQALSLQRLQAVVTDKGCYPGQEIVARLHFRGGHKRHLHSAMVSRLLASGTRLRVQGADIGGLLDVHTVDGQTRALLVLADSAEALATNGRLDVHDENLTITLCTRWPG